MLATLIPTILNLIAAILESLFVASSSSSRKFGNADSGSSHRDPDKLTESDRSAAVLSAQTFFDLTSDEVMDRDIVKRTYKKLSLRHHPDRNANSPESVKMMQKLNHHYDVLEKELDRAEGMTNDDEDDVPDQEDEDDSGFESRSGSDDYDTDDSPPPQSGIRGKKARRRRNARRRKKSEGRRRQHDKERAKMEREMRREWEEIKRKKQEMKAKTRQVRKESKKVERREGLDTVDGRDRANKVWEEEVRRAKEAEEEEAEEAKKGEGVGSRNSSAGASVPGSLHDIDEDVHVPSTAEGTSGSPSGPAKEKGPTGKGGKSQTASSPAKNNDKPAVTNPVMECCTDDVVLALRLDAPEVAIDGMQEELTKALPRHLECVLREGRRPTEDDFNDGVRRYLLLCIDADGNTILHYAVYYGSPDVIDYVVHLARRCGAFADVVLNTNRHGHIPLDYGRGRSTSAQNDVQAKMEYLTEIARREIEDKQFMPSFKKAARRLWGVVKNFNPVPAANTVLPYVVGTRVFGCGWVAPVLICVFARGEQGDVTGEGKRTDNDGAQSAASLFAAYSMWALLRIICASLYRTLSLDSAVPFALILIPFGIMFCCAEKSKNASRVLSMVLLPLGAALFAYRCISDLIAVGAGSIAVPKFARKVGLEQTYYLTLLSMMFYIAL